MVDKVRGEPRWEGWAFVAPRFVQDVLAVLNQARPLYIDLLERKEQRSRWIQGLTVQTIDPEIEDLE
jgi:hypothetical protein